MKSIMQLTVCLFLFAICANGIASSVILNEYNAVGDDKWLKDSGSDVYFGRIMANGGDWFELVAVEDVDMRGWTIVWSNSDPSTDDIYLSQDDFWSNIKAGTIITFAQDMTIHGGLDTDISWNGTTDWWVNICTEEEQLKYNASQSWLSRTKNNDDTGHIKTDNDDWKLTIYDDDDNLVFGPAGEGTYTMKGIGSDEVCYLYDDPSTSIGSYSHYDDGTHSTFGAPNIASDANQGLEDGRVQDFSQWWGDPTTCEQAKQMGYEQAGDLDGDCRVNLNDFAIFAAEWASCFDPENVNCDHPWDN